jgi:hypothetical protein
MPQHLQTAGGNMLLVVSMICHEREARTRLPQAFHM